MAWLRLNKHGSNDTIIINMDYIESIDRDHTQGATRLWIALSHAEEKILVDNSPGEIYAALTTGCNASHTQE